MSETTRRPPAERVGQVLRRVVPELLAPAMCPRCCQSGTLRLFDDPNNNGLGILCDECGRHPYPTLMWLPQGPARRSSEVSRVAIEQGGDWCAGCGITREEAGRLHLGLQVHHTLPFAEVGDDGPQILLCATCHQLVTAIQQRVGAMRRLHLLDPVGAPV